MVSDRDRNATGPCFVTNDFCPSCGLGDGEGVDAWLYWTEVANNKRLEVAHHRYLRRIRHVSRGYEISKKTVRLRAAEVPRTL